MFLLLLSIWFIFNGKVTAEIVALGIVLSALIYLFMCKFMGYSLQRDFSLMRRGLFFLYYIGVLIVEIIKANGQVIHLVWTDREAAEPVIVDVRTSLQTRIGRVILANSITLTPGTITISLDEDELTVHCLDKEMAEGLKDSVFERLLKRMENGWN